MVDLALECRNHIYNNGRKACGLCRWRECAPQCRQAGHLGTKALRRDGAPQSGRRPVWPEQSQGREGRRQAGSGRLGCWAVEPPSAARGDSCGPQQGCAMCPTFWLALSWACVRTRVGGRELTSAVSRWEVAVRGHSENRPKQHCKHGVHRVC